MPTWRRDNSAVTATYRCRPESQTELGAKIEIKNLNSISGVRRALAYEIGRQVRALENGETLEQETRGWNDAAGETFLMRTKEFAHDYRYFPDPDLVPVKTEVLLDEVRALVPELPKAKRGRFVQQYQVSPYDAAVLASDLDLARYFEAAVKGATKPKNVAKLDSERPTETPSLALVKPLTIVRFHQRHLMSWSI